ncbi:NADase-type glycan-binding domain-containing protein [Spirochaeta cellobiosiphila]|uniref:NADase-type glycan-binding domain-containing protein n=1 Tax=Spirochaeta cellobiosiphila TaxID=504483 RepID=UPI00040EF779|nr:hypothetical protein [Spirochaeta cellobiosiphila]
MRTISFVIISLLLVITVEAQDSKVRYNLDYIESFDGVMTEYYSPRLIPVDTPDVSSTLGNYTADRLVDGDSSSAWIEGVEGKGEGQTITFDVNLNAIPRVIAIYPGYMKSQKLFDRNCRPEKLRIRWLGFDESREDPYFEITSLEVELLKDTNGKVSNKPQYIYISNSAFLQNMEVSELSLLTIEILSVDDKGAIDPDMAISEIQLYSEGDFVKSSM